MKKSLGQHFLTDENICRKIIEEVQQRPFTHLLEIGPGGGALTKYLMNIKNIDIKAVEIDREKADILLRTYPGLKGKLVLADFLKMKRPFSSPFTVVGNFPYNISSQIVFKLLEWKGDIECITGMFQKEMAQRISAKEGSKVYGVLSVLVQAFFRVEYLFEVSEKCFYPPPKVKSAVIQLIPRAGKTGMKSEKDLFLLVKSAFGQRRKKLRNAVKKLFEEETLQDTLFDRRAEQLSVREFGDLTYKMI